MHVQPERQNGTFRAEIDENVAANGRPRWFGSDTAEQWPLNRRLSHTQIYAQQAPLAHHKALQLKSHPLPSLTCDFCSRFSSSVEARQLSGSFSQVKPGPIKRFHEKRANWPLSVRNAIWTIVSSHSSSFRTVQAAFE